MKIETISLTDKEKALVDDFAKQEGLSAEEAAAALFAGGLAQRVRRQTRRAPARNVTNLRRGK